VIQIIFRTALPLLPLLVDLIGGIDVAVGKNIIFAESPDNISEIILLLLAEILKIRRRAAGRLFTTSCRAEKMADTDCSAVDASVLSKCERSMTLLLINAK